MTSTRVVRIGLIGAVALAAVAVGCGDDDESSAVDSVEEWCAKVEEIDTGFETTDNSSDPFEVKQSEYAAINAKLDDLTDAIELVPEESRDAVAATVGWAAEFTDVFVGAESEEAAAELLFGEDGVFASEPELDPAGAVWIDQTCGIDIDGEG